MVSGTRKPLKIGVSYTRNTIFPERHRSPSGIILVLQKSSKLGPKWSKDRKKGGSRGDVKKCHFFEGPGTGKEQKRAEKSLKWSTGFL